MHMSTVDTALLGTGVVLAVIVGIAIIYGVSGIIFATLWNWLVPSLWAAAPHMTWKMGVAMSWLISIVQSIFGGGIKLDTKELTKK